MKIFDRSNAENIHNPDLRKDISPMGSSVVRRDYPSLRVPILCRPRQRMKY